VTIAGAVTVTSGSITATISGTPTVTVSGTAAVSIAGTVATSNVVEVADGTAFDNDTTKGIPTFGVYQSTPDALTDGDMGPALLDSNRRQIVVDPSSEDILGALDLLAAALTGGNLGVSIEDQANALAIHDNAATISTDPQLPASQVWKVFSTTTNETGTVVWAGGASEYINITYLSVANVGTDAGICILYFGADADTTYSEGTDQVVFHGAVTAVAGANTHVISMAAAPITSVTAGHDLHITTTGNPDLKVIVYGYIST
jgi:hypothetical protein